MAYCAVDKEHIISSIIKEELTKADVTSTFDNKIKSSDFKREIKSIVADCVEELFRELWQRKSFWKDAVKR